jgi:hypothetical protein
MFVPGFLEQFAQAVDRAIGELLDGRLGLIEFIGDLAD